MQLVKKVGEGERGKRERRQKRRKRQEWKEDMIVKEEGGGDSERLVREDSEWKEV